MKKVDENDEKERRETTKLGNYRSEYLHEVASLMILLIKNLAWN